MTMWTYDDGVAICQWCGRAMGFILPVAPGLGQVREHGVLTCPRCDWVHAAAAGPPVSTERLVDQ